MTQSTKMLAKFYCAMAVIVVLTVAACGQLNADKEQAKPKMQYKVTCIFNGKVEIHTGPKIWVDDDGTWVQSGVRYSPGVPCKREIIPVPSTVELAPIPTLSPATPE